MTDIITELIEAFKRFPGIGPRQAKRFVYHLLGESPTEVNRLLNLIRSLAADIKQCAVCFRYFPLTPSRTDNVCAWCKESEHAAALLIVEKDIDAENIRRSGAFQGQFFILGGLVPILESQPEVKVRSKQLLTYLDRRLKNKSPPLHEIIIALSAHPDGDNTGEYLLRLLDRYRTENDIKITFLGRGLSTGIELEYSDTATLQHALRNRQSSPS